MIFYARTIGKSTDQRQNKAMNSDKSHEYLNQLRYLNSTNNTKESLYIYYSTLSITHFAEDWRRANQKLSLTIQQRSLVN